MNKRIKVAHIITKMELGGAQQNTLYTVTQLNKEKFDTVLICGTGGILDKEAGLVLKNKIFFVPYLVRKINPVFDFLALIRIGYLLRREHIDIAHTHSSKAGIVGRWAAKLAGVPYIIHTYHGFGFNSCQRWFVYNFFVWIERITAKITFKLITVSYENIEKGLLNKIGKKEQYSVIHSGIKIEKIRGKNYCIEEKKKELNLGNKDFIVGMIACFKPQKDPLSFVLLADRVARLVPNVNFLLVGDGVLRPSIEKLIVELKLENNIKLLGWRRDVSELVHIFDIMVLTSLWEGLPRVLLEAMVCGVAVVATDVDGAREVINDGVNGFLVAPKDIDKMAEKVIYLLNNSEERKEIGKKAKEAITTSFDIDEMIKEIEILYGELFF